MLNKTMTKLAALAFATTAALASANAFAKDNIMLAYADPEDSVFGKAAIAFADKLAEVSGGEMTVTPFPNGTLGAISEIPAMLQQGACDATLIVTSSLVDLCPEMGVFDLPFLFADYDDAYKVVYGEAGNYLKGKLAEQNMVISDWLTMGFREVTSNKPINSLADFKGIKIRTQSNEIHQAIFSALGASPTIISFSELYTALEQGTVDAQENPYVNIYNNTYFDVQKYLIETNHVFQVSALVFSKATMDEFTEQQKQWITEASKYASDVEWQVTKEDNEKARQGAIDKGMTFVKLDHQLLLDATKSVYDQYRGNFGELLKLMGK